MNRDEFVGRVRDRTIGFTSEVVDDVAKEQLGEVYDKLQRLVPDVSSDIVGVIADAYGAGAGRVVRDSRLAELHSSGASSR